MSDIWVKSSSGLVDHISVKLRPGQISFSAIKPRPVTLIERKNVAASVSHFNNKRTKYTTNVAAEDTSFIFVSVLYLLDCLRLCVRSILRFCFPSHDFLMMASGMNTVVSLGVSWIGHVMYLFDLIFECNTN